MCQRWTETEELNEQREGMNCAPKHIHKAHSSDCLWVWMMQKRRIFMRHAMILFTIELKCVRILGDNISFPKKRANLSEISFNHVIYFNKKLNCCYSSYMHLFQSIENDEIFINMVNVHSTKDKYRSKYCFIWFNFQNW